MDVFTRTGGVPLAFVIATYDKPDHKHVRDSVRQRHLEYLEANVKKVIAGGGFFNDDGTLVIGGLLIVDVDTRAEAETFIRNDPFTAADLFQRVEINRWKCSFLDFKRVAPAPARA
jgi:uncharacterized protein YciI